jgi:hypothetical protein
VLFKKRREEKRDTISDCFRMANINNSPIKFNTHSIEAKGGNNKVCLIKNNILEMKSILEKISAEKEKECKYINFMDENSIFYQGSWHIKKLCKYGLGYAYMIDSNKGKRYKYYGYFKDDLYHGVGLLLYEDGYAYFGEFRNGVRCGFGKEYRKDVSYFGFFKNNKYHGYGEYNYNNKISYFGNFSRGIREGYGMLSMADGALYCGTFKFNKMHGIGNFHWPAGQTYYGAWKEDKMNGVGRYKWVNRDEYIGYYENDLRHGRGEYYFKNGAALYGVWRMSKKEGKFELIEKGHIYKISYRNDIQINY